MSPDRAKVHQKLQTSSGIEQTAPLITTVIGRNRPYLEAPGIGMPEERVPVKGAFPLVGFRVWTRVAGTVSRRIGVCGC